MSQTVDAETPAVLRKIMARDLPREVPKLPVNESYAPPAERDRLTRLEAELSRSPLDEIAYRLTQLNFGDMVEFAGGVSAEPGAVWKWATDRPRN